LIPEACAFALVKGGDGGGGRRVVGHCLRFRKVYIF
jgi:hypothetical protein